MYHGSCLVCFCFHASKVCNSARVCVVCGEPQAQTDSSQLTSPLPCDCVRQQWATNGTADRHMSCSSSHGHYWGILFTLKKNYFQDCEKVALCLKSSKEPGDPLAGLWHFCGLGFNVNPNYTVKLWQTSHQRHVQQGCFDGQTLCKL